MFPEAKENVFLIIVTKHFFPLPKESFFLAPEFFSCSEKNILVGKKKISLREEILFARKKMLVSKKKSHHIDETVFLASRNQFCGREIN